MTQTQTIKDQLRAIHEEIQSAAQKEDAGAKQQVRTVMSRLQTVRTAIKGDITKDNAIRDDRTDEVLAKIQNANDEGEKALDASGEALQEKVHAMQRSIKSAIESA